MVSYTKDPDAVLDYGWDWSTWLDGDTITASTWEADTGVTIASDTFAATSTTVWLSGGTAGTRYKLTNHITTAAGREDDRSLYIVAREK